LYDSELRISSLANSLCRYKAVKVETVSVRNCLLPSGQNRRKSSL